RRPREDASRPIERLLPQRLDGRIQRRRSDPVFGKRSTNARMCGGVVTSEGTNRDVGGARNGHARSGDECETGGRLSIRSKHAVPPRDRSTEIEHATGLVPRREGRNPFEVVTRRPMMKSVDLHPGDITSREVEGHEAQLVELRSAWHRSGHRRPRTAKAEAL